MEHIYHQRILLPNKILMSNVFCLESVFGVNKLRSLLYEKIGSQGNCNKPRGVIKVSISIKSGMTLLIKYTIYHKIAYFLNLH